MSDRWTGLRRESSMLLGSCLRFDVCVCMADDINLISVKKSATPTFLTLSKHATYPCDCVTQEIALRTNTEHMHVRTTKFYK